MTRRRRKVKRKKKGIVWKMGNKMKEIMVVCIAVFIFLLICGNHDSEASTLFEAESDEKIETQAAPQCPKCETINGRRICRPCLPPPRPPHFWSHSFYYQKNNLCNALLLLLIYFFCFSFFLRWFFIRPFYCQSL